VANTYNSNYSGGRDQEDCGLKPTQANSWQDPISKNPFRKRAVGMVQTVGDEFKPQYLKKKKRKKKTFHFHI
jgi:hypothetical protein